MAGSYRQHLGVGYFVVSGIVQSADAVERLRVCLGATELSVCRLHAPLDVVEGRLRARQPPDALAWFLERAALLDLQLPSDGLDDFVVDASQAVDRIAQAIADGCGRDLRLRLSTQRDGVTFAMRRQLRGRRFRHRLDRP